MVKGEVYSLSMCEHGFFESAKDYMFWFYQGGMNGMKDKNNDFVAGKCGGGTAGDREVNLRLGV